MWSQCSVEEMETLSGGKVSSNDGSVVVESEGDCSAVVPVAPLKWFNITQMITPVQVRCVKYYTDKGPSIKDVWLTRGEDRKKIDNKYGRLLLF